MMEDSSDITIAETRLYYMAEINSKAREPHIPDWDLRCSYVLPAYDVRE